uniref:Dolichyldiphosphatase n=1 Tax=Alexandrium monilatum TaxID=311494 RepID=A0A7S4T527_9DINO
MVHPAGLSSACLCASTCNRTFLASTCTRTFLGIWLLHAIRCGGVPDNDICAGTWTSEWAKEKGNIPESVQLRIKHSGNEELRKAIERHECPFGVALPGDVTWPKPPKALEGVVGGLDCMVFAMVIWSFIPYCVACYLVLIFLAKRGTRQLWTVLWIGLFVCLNELVVKRFLLQPRPGTFLEVRDYNGKFRGSCLKTCGMPSSHAGITSGLFVLIFLDGVFRVRAAETAEAGRRGPRRRARRSCPAADSAADSAAPQPAERPRTIRDDCFECLHYQRSDISLDGRSTLTHFEFVAHVTFWFVVLVPSAQARIILFDHTSNQVITGQLFGVALACTWWWAVRCLQYAYSGSVGKSFCRGLLTHNFPVAGGRPDAQEQNGYDSESGSLTASSSD